MHFNCTYLCVIIHAVRDDCDQGVESPCKNGGLCLDELGGYTCECTANFTGDTCTVPGTVFIEKLSLIIVYCYCKHCRILILNICIGSNKFFDAIVSLIVVILLQLWSHCHQTSSRSQKMLKQTSWNQ